MALAIGWRLVKPAVVENTGDRLEGGVVGRRADLRPGVSPDDLDVAEQDPEDHRLTDIELDGRLDFDGRHDARRQEGLR